MFFWGWEQIFKNWKKKKKDIGLEESRDQGKCRWERLKMKKIQI